MPEQNIDRPKLYFHHFMRLHIEKYLSPACFDVVEELIWKHIIEGFKPIIKEVMPMPSLESVKEQVIELYAEQARFFLMDIEKHLSKELFIATLDAIQYEISNAKRR